MAGSVSMLMRVGLRRVRRVSAVAILDLEICLGTQYLSRRNQKRQDEEHRPLNDARLSTLFLGILQMKKIRILVFFLLLF